MQSLRVVLTVCVSAVASLLGCDDGADNRETQSDATTCTIVRNGSAWWNQSFTEQTGRFHVDYAVTPTSNRVDLVVGLSSGAATKWSSLAAIARLNPQGYIDARAGATYRADVVYPYQAGVTYYFRFDVDMQTRTYSVWLREHPEARFALLARDYQFRNEQASVTRLDNVASFVNPETSPTGTAGEVCGFAATRDATTADGCVVAASGSGFGNGPIATSAGALVAQFQVKASHDGMDGVIGFASGDADAYNDYAASMRFFTNGRFEARDGDAYRADNAIAYRAGQVYDVAFVVDVPSKTYSVFVAGPGLEPESGNPGHVALARGYRFRPQQATVPQLDRLVNKVETSFGRVDACGMNGIRNNVLSARLGAFDAYPLANGGAVVSDGATTWQLDANNAALGSVNAGGKVATDAVGNIYVARIASGSFVLSTFTPTYQTRWTTTFASSGASDVGDIVITRANEVLVSVGVASNDWSARFSPLGVLRFANDGRLLSSHATPSGATAVALGPDGFAHARAFNDGVIIDVNAASGSLMRSLYQPGSFDVTHMALAPDGSLVIGGHASSVDFGTGEIRPYAPTPDSGVYWDAYVAAFWPDFSTRFAQRLYNELGGIAATNDTIVVSSDQWTQLRYVAITVFDTSGRVLREWQDDGILSHFGSAASGVALGSSGRVYANIEVPFHGSFDQTWPFFVILPP